MADDALEALKRIFDIPADVFDAPLPEEVPTVQSINVGDAPRYELQEIRDAGAGYPQFERDGTPTPPSEQASPSDKSQAAKRSTRYTLPDDIAGGDRHSELYRFARSLRARGYALDEALDACQAINETRCKPPLQWTGTESDRAAEPYLRRVWRQDAAPGFTQPPVDQARDASLRGEGLRLRRWYALTESEILKALTLRNFRLGEPPAQQHEVEELARQCARAKFSVFECNKDGKPHPNSQTNIKLALSELNVEPVWDTFADKILLRKDDALENFDDRIAITLWLQIERRFHFLPTREKFDAVVKTVAWENAWHPVRAYLSSLQWDNQPRIDEWLIAYGGAPDTPFVRAVSALMLIAAVRRILQPGCKFDEMVILESEQGKNKSSALRSLCPNDAWFSDDLPLNVDAKQVIERTAGKWIIEAAELHGRSKAEVEHLKSMLSRQVDGPVRLAYGRLPTEVPRQFIIVGTTNTEHGYLKDSTGNRRFWPVRTAQFHVSELKRDRDQLWAEAVVREAAGESIRLDESLYAAAAEQQQQRELDDAWYDLLFETFGADGPLIVETEDVWITLGKLANQRNNNDGERVARVMQKLGFNRKQKLWRVKEDRHGMRRRVQRQCWIRADGDAEADLPSFVREDDGL